VIVGGGRGGHGFDLAHPSLIFTGVVDHIERYVNAADVVIVPLAKGGGTRIKILEAIACGKPVVSTSKGAEGLINDLTRPFVKIADVWDTFASHVVTLLKSRRCVKVPKEFVRRYSWQEIYSQFDELLAQVAAPS
jgi:glycosyltransferase involved in cell wall biosynthesis